MAAPVSPETNSLPCLVFDDSTPRRSTTMDTQVLDNTSAASQSEEDATCQSPESVGRAEEYSIRLDKLPEDIEYPVQNINGDEDYGSSSGSDNNGRYTIWRHGEERRISSCIPEVRYCNYHQFVNHYREDWEKAYAIEVLRSGSQLEREIVHK